MDALCQRISKEYDYVLTNIPIYSKRKRLIGEADILGFKDGYMDIYEVKCSHRISKAKRQLSKLCRLLNTDRDMHKIRDLYFFCGTSNTIMCCTP